MAKSEKVVVYDETGNGHETPERERVALGDIDENEPLLPPGTYAVQWIGHKVEEKEGDRGSYTQALVMLDPVELVEGDEDELPSDFEDIRQFHRLYLDSARDIRAAKRLVTAFGVTDPAIFLFDRAEDGKVIYPAFEAARGNVAKVTVKLGENRRSGEAENKLSSFQAM